MMRSDPSAQHPSASKLTKSKNAKKGKKRNREDSSQHSSSALPAAKRAHISTSSDGHVMSENLLSAQDLINETRSLEIDICESASPLAPSLVESLSAYEVTNMNIISSSQIQAKVTRLLQTLGNFSFVAPTKPNIVALHAKGPVSSKLITIVEITKREVSKAGGKWYQYNGLAQAMVVQDKLPAEIDDTTAQKANGNVDSIDIVNDDDEIDEGESTFETMKTPFERVIEGKTHVQAIPVMTIFLSRVRIESLKKAYGEQTNALT